MAIGNKLVLEDSNRFGNQFVVDVANNFDPRKFSNRRFTPRAGPSFNVRRLSRAGDKDIELQDSFSTHESVPMNWSIRAVTRRTQDLGGNHAVKGLVERATGAAGQALRLFYRVNAVWNKVSRNITSRQIMRQIAFGPWLSNNLPAASKPQTRNTRISLEQHNE
ncbi:MAG: hypothetical protein ABSA45_02505 [Verrucomicrobiota bacterium]